MTPDITLVRGDDYVGTRRLVVTIRDAAGALQSLTGVTATFMVKGGRNDADADALISKALVNDADQTTNKGKAYVSIAGTDTAGLAANNGYFVEIQAVDGVGVFTVLRGRLALIGDLIREAP